ncbi:MAG: DUF4157 domain-containing protein [Thermodesulfobacteriota bacterium]|nr:DUF4157 domain-containing protein [Thermodesulfobacteriota bacterium]
MSERASITAKTPEAKSNKPASKSQGTDFSQSTRSPVDHIMFLQRTIGNQAVQRLFKSGAIQAKLKIGQPNDIYEQEADRVADEVMRMPEPAIQPKPTYPLTNDSSCGDEEPIQSKPLTSKITPLVQRQPIEEEEGEILQTKESSNKSPIVSSNLETNIQLLKTEGTPLPEPVRAFFEPRFGYDFSKVKLHTSTRAAELARTVNAKAFTVGKDVTFGAGQYSPETSGGKKLLAHELTHVVQQNRTVQRKPTSRLTDKERKIIRSRPEIQVLEGKGEVIQRAQVEAGTLITMLEEYGRGVVLRGLADAQRSAINDFLDELGRRADRLTGFWSMLSGAGGGAGLAGTVGAAETAGIAGVGPWAIFGALIAAGGIWYASEWTKEGVQSSLSSARSQLLEQADAHGRQYHSTVLSLANSFGGRVARGEEAGLSADTQQYNRIREVFRARILQAPSTNRVYDLKWNQLCNRWNIHLRGSRLWRIPAWRGSAQTLIMQSRRVRP